MPEEFDPEWEYWEPDPEIAEVMGGRQGCSDMFDLVEDAHGMRLVTPHRYVKKGRKPKKVKPPPPPRVIATVDVTCACGKRFTKYQSSPVLSCSRVCAAVLREETRSHQKLHPKRCPTCRNVFATIWKLKRYCSLECNPFQHHRQRPKPIEELVLTLDDARYLIGQGVLFGDVLPHVPEQDHEELRIWFTHTPGLPNIAARNPPPSSGNDCKRCGGPMVRTGTCETCNLCGESSAGCG